MRHPPDCKADVTKPGCVYDWNCDSCKAEYLEGRGLHVDAVKLAVVDEAGPGAAMLAARA